jgi:hypothetical protein
MVTMNRSAASVLVTSSEETEDEEEAEERELLTSLGSDSASAKAGLMNSPGIRKTANRRKKRGLCMKKLGKESRHTQYRNS